MRHWTTRMTAELGFRKSLPATRPAFITDPRPPPEFAGQCEYACTISYKLHVQNAVQVCKNMTSSNQLIAQQSCRQSMQRALKLSRNHHHKSYKFQHLVINIQSRKPKDMTDTRARTIRIDLRQDDSVLYLGMPDVFAMGSIDD